MGDSISEGKRKKVPGIDHCAFHKAWVGPCQNEPTSNGNCHQHQKKCKMCGALARRNCPEVHGPLCCGVHLCDDCTCECFKKPPWPLFGSPPRLKRVTFQLEEILDLSEFGSSPSELDGLSEEEIEERLKDRLQGWFSLYNASEHMQKTMKIETTQNILECLKCGGEGEFAEGSFGTMKNKPLRCKECGHMWDRI